MNENASVAFKFSGEEYAKYDKLNWLSIYKEMSKDHELYKILKKNNYYKVKSPEFNEISSILSDIPLKEGLKSSYFDEYYQKNLSKYLENKISISELINNLNFPRITSKKEVKFAPRDSQVFQTFLQQNKFKRLNIKDIKLVLERLNAISVIQKKHNISTLSNMSFSTTDFLSNTMNFNPDATLNQITMKEKFNNINTDQLKYSIIKNLIFEKFKEREERKKTKKHVKIQSLSQIGRLPKILQNIEAIEGEILDKIDHKNLSSINPRHNSFYLNHQRKLSDGTLKSERKPLSTDSKAKSCKKLVEDYKSRKIMYSNLKYHINKSADGYLDSLSHFKNVSKNFNKSIILKEEEDKKVGRNGGKRCSLGVIPQSKAKKKPLGLWDYLHHSNLIDQHKAGLISNIGISDMFLEKDKIFLDDGAGFKVKCDRDLKDLMQSDQIYQKNQAMKAGEFSRVANGMLKPNQIAMKPLKRYFIPKRAKSLDVNNIPNEDGNESLQSINENKLDLLYKESISLQKRIKAVDRSTVPEKIKRIIKLEDLNKTIIEINKRKLHQYYTFLII